MKGEKRTMMFEKAAFEASYGTFSQLPPSNMPEVAFAGRSNVGKSSLLNKLTNRKSLARVSSSPGKTTTINFFDVENIKLVDLPGYGYAKVSRAEKLRWSELMEGYFSSNRNIRLVIQLIDMRHPPTENDLSMLSYLIQTGYPFIIVLTKSDKLNKSEREKRLSLINEELKEVGISNDIKIIPFSAIKGEGVDVIKEIIEKSVL